LQQAQAQAQAQKHWILNLSTLHKGGAVQVAISFLHDLSDLYHKNIEPHSITIFLSSTLASQISPSILQKFKHHIFPISPARSQSARKHIEDLIQAIHPDLVFSLFGPCYLQINHCPHLMGICNGWSTHADKLAFSAFSTPFQKIKRHLTNLYLKKHLKHATHWITEAPIAQKGAIKKLKLPPEKIFIIPNEVSIFYKPYLNQAPQLINTSPAKPLNLFIFCSAYPHKNIKILIPTLIALLQKNISQARFHLTLPESSREYQNLFTQIKKYDLENYFINHGPTTPQDGTELYKKMDALLFPSLLETYSVTPLEAITMGIPVLLSNIAAHQDLFTEDLITFFNPLDPEDIANQIIKLIQHPELALIKQIQAKAWLQKILSEKKSRTQAYLELVNQIISPTQPTAAASSPAGLPPDRHLDTTRLSAELQPQNPTADATAIADELYRN